MILLSPNEVRRIAARGEWPEGLNYHGIAGLTPLPVEQIEAWLAECREFNELLGTPHGDDVATITLNLEKPT